MLRRLMVAGLALVALSGLAGCGASRLTGVETGYEARARAADRAILREDDPQVPPAAGATRIEIEQGGGGGEGGGVDPNHVPDFQIR